MEITDTR